MPQVPMSPPAVLGGRYTLERELGRGGMATVWLATDHKHRRRVAVKVLRAEIAATIGAARFLREIEIVAGLTHPHVLPLHDSGEHAGVIYYVMPYVEGESLRDRLRREGQLPLDEAIRIGRDVAAALAYAHAHGVIHRDIKPENILLEGDEAVVADFGVARALDAAATEAISEPGLVFGTPAYMSPEQACGEALDGRSDLYALGCVLYEMLVGEPPFTGPTAQVIVARHRTEPPRPLRGLRPAVPPELEAVTLTLLAKSPADRPRTALEVVRRLSPPASGEYGAIRAPPPETAAARPPPRRWWRRLFGGPGLGLGLLALVSYALLAPGRTGGHDDPAGPSPASEVAVLYLEDHTADGRFHRIADGLTEDLIDRLGQVPALRVISANGVRRYRGAAAPPESIGRELGVGTLVTGSVEGEGSRPRVVVRLIDAADGRQLASRRLVADGGLLPLRDTLAAEVVDFLRFRLGREIDLRERRASTADEGAWLLLLRAEAARDDARALFAAGDHAAAARALAVADSLLALAEARDPRWGEPAVQRAWVAVDRIELDTQSGAAVRRWVDLGEGHAGRALALRERAPGGVALSAAALEVRGLLRFVGSDAGPDPAAARAAAERDLRAAAVPDHPARARALSTLSRVLLARGAFAEAHLAARRAYEADAFLAESDAVLFRLHHTALVLGRWEEAAAWCDRGRARFPDAWLFTFCRLTLLMMPEAPASDPDSAWRRLAELERLVPPGERGVFAPRWRMMVAGALARAGLPDSARRVLQRARAAGRGDPELDFYEAAARVLLGEEDAALACLGRYLGANPDARRYVAVDPVLRRLADRPDFRRLVGAR